MRLPGRAPAGPILRRLGCAALLTALVLAAACAALSVTSAPAVVSLLVEPFSLLLVPGLLMAVAATGSHAEVSASAILMASAAFYFALFAVVLWQRRTRTHRRSR